MAAMWGLSASHGVMKSGEELTHSLNAMKSKLDLPQISSPEGYGGDEEVFVTSALLDTGFHIVSDYINGFDILKTDKVAKETHQAAVGTIYEGLVPFPFVQDMTAPNFRILHHVGGSPTESVGKVSNHFGVLIKLDSEPIDGPIYCGGGKWRNLP